MDGCIAFSSGIVVAFLILFIIVLIGIIFDIIGVSVTSADEAPFHAMASRKVSGAKEAIRLLRQAEKVSSICNDVIGDICGVVSGSASATIAVQILNNFEFTWPRMISLIMSALVAGLTVGGKAIGKTFAVNSSTKIVHTVGKIIYGLNHIPELSNVGRIFENVYAYLTPGGYFVFDLLDEHEVSTAEPFDLQFDEVISARFQITRPDEKRVHLQTQVFENGIHSFTEDIYEMIHDREAVLELLRRAGFEIVKCAHRLLDDGAEVATWYIIARKPL